MSKSNNPTKRKRFTKEEIEQSFNKSLEEAGWHTIEIVGPAINIEEVKMRRFNKKKIND